MPSKQSHHTNTFDAELEASAVSGGIFVVASSGYYTFQSLNQGLALSCLLIAFISLSTFWTSMTDAFFDERSAFLAWISDVSWSHYSAQTSAAVLLVATMYGFAYPPETPQLSAVSVMAVLCITMVAVAVWYAQETLVAKTER